MSHLIGAENRNEASGKRIRPPLGRSGWEINAVHVGLTGFLCNHQKLRQKRRYCGLTLSKICIYFADRNSRKGVGNSRILGNFTPNEAIFGQKMANNTKMKRD